MGWETSVQCSAFIHAKTSASNVTLFVHDMSKSMRTSFQLILKVLDGVRGEVRPHKAKLK